MVNAKTKKGTIPIDGDKFRFWWKEELQISRKAAAGKLGISEGSITRYSRSGVQRANIGEFEEMERKVPGLRDRVGVYDPSRAAGRFSIVMVEFVHKATNSERTAALQKMPMEDVRQLHEAIGEFLGWPATTAPRPKLETVKETAGVGRPKRLKARASKGKRSKRGDAEGAAAG